MKRISILLLTAVFLSLHPAAAADHGPGSSVIDLKNVPLSQLLSIYQELSGLELVIDSRARRIDAPITLEPSGPITKDEVVKLMERKFIEQAGVVITRLDDKRASVTYNDALTLKH